MASAAANRYPVPLLLGWRGRGELDAKITHLAKLRSLTRYLDSLPPEEDNDLAIMVDGYDVIQQLPVEILLERYFEVAKEADARLAQQYGISLEELHRRNISQTIFWGPDKVCWPIDPRAARCWAVPGSSIRPGAFGPPGQFDTSDPRWLNSGTVMGPIGHLRELIYATMDEIAYTYDTDYEHSESDQYYLSNVWGRQEYWRARQLGNGTAKSSPAGHIIPVKRFEEQQTEMHVAIEYESRLFQTRAGNDPFLGYPQYEQNSTIKVTKDYSKQEKRFVPYSIELPANVRDSLMRLYDSIPEAHPGASSADWVRKAHLGTNFVTKQIYAIWHCTGSKDRIKIEYTKMWFYPFIKSLIRASVRAAQRGEPMTPKLIDGRKWVSKFPYPRAEELQDEYGGAWSDQVPGHKFVAWKSLCRNEESDLFWGQEATGLEGRTVGKGR